MRRLNSWFKVMLDYLVMAACVLLIIDGPAAGTHESIFHGRSPDLQ